MMKVAASLHVSDTKYRKTVVRLVQHIFTNRFILPGMRRREGQNYYNDSNQNAFHDDWLIGRFRTFLVATSNGHHLLSQNSSLSMQEFFFFWLRMAAGRTIRVAILSCAILANQPFSAPNCVVGMFEAFLQAGLDKMKHDYRFSDTNIAFDRYNCVAGQLPNLNADLDAIIITGSAASVRDCDTWILHLKKFIYGKLLLHRGALRLTSDPTELYLFRPEVKLFGTCFGHQILSAVLLRDVGAVVEENPKGWETGVHSIRLNPEFLSFFPYQSHLDMGMVTRSLQFIHREQVLLSGEELPPEWIIVGGNKSSRIQGIFKPRRVLSFQGHPEYTSSHCCMLLQRMTTWDPAQNFGNEDLKRVKRESDSQFFAEILIEFLYN